MDALTETLYNHNKALKEKQRMLSLIPRVKEKIEADIDKLQSEISIMSEEIKAGKNLLS